MGWKGIRVRLRWSSEVEKRHDFLCSSFLSSLLRFFNGKLSCGKYCGVCHVDAEKEKQCLAAGVACRYPAYAVVLFLIAETALHGGRAQSADYPSCGANVGIFFLWLRAFAYKAGSYAVFGAVPPVVVVGIDCVGSDSGHFDACQFLLIFNALLEPYALVEGFEGVMLDEGYSVNLYVVDLGSELHALVLLASDYGTDIGAVYADNAVLHLLFLS